MPSDQKTRGRHQWLLGIGLVVLLAAAVLGFVQMMAHYTLEREFSRIRAADGPSTPRQIVEAYPHPEGPNAAEYFLQAAETFTPPRVIAIPDELEPLIEAERQRHEQTKNRQQQREPIQPDPGHRPQDGNASQSPSPDEHAELRPPHAPEPWQPPQSLDDLVPVIGSARLPEEPGEPWPELMRKASAYFLERNAGTLELVMEGAALDSGWGPSPIINGRGSADYLPAVRTLSSLMILQMLMAAEQEDIDLIIKSVDATCALAQTLEHHPLYTQFFTHVGVRTRLGSYLPRVLERPIPWTDEQLETLMNRTAELARDDLLHSTFIVERVYWLEQIDAGEGRDEFPFPHRLSGTAHRGMIHLLRYYSRFIDAADGPPPQRRASFDRLAAEIEAMPDRYLPVRQILRAIVTGMPDSDLRGLAYDRLTHTALAIERYRIEHDAPPDALESLRPEWLDEVPRDPFDDEPLRYQPINGGYLLYSIGTNREDDGGTPRQRSGEGDIVFQVIRP